MSDKPGTVDKSGRADKWTALSNDSLGVTDHGCKRATRQRKSRSFYGENPSSQLGPKGLLCQSSVLTIPDPADQKLQWNKPPITGLVIKKPDCDLVEAYKSVICYLTEQKNLRVIVEAGSVDALNLPAPVIKCVTQFRKADELYDKVDFIVTLGGDGTLIHASSLFQKSMPPVLAFNMGSFGFLTPFDFSEMRSAIDSALAGNVCLTLRSRLKCVVGTKDQHEDLLHVKEIENGHHKHLHLTTYSVVNEVVVDRGPSSYLCNLELYVNRQLVTSVQGDGIIISTPTGSTAYATAAGASMVHPCVPAILIVPICPHSLSFRPIILPAGVEVSIMLSPGARSTAWAAFDGRFRTEIKHGELIRITTSIYPLPSICAQGHLEDWFNCLAECLHWNVRKPQKAFHISNGLSEVSSTSSLAEESAPTESASNGN